jgi:hypothetical protein
VLESHRNIDTQIGKTKITSNQLAMSRMENIWPMDLIWERMWLRRFGKNIKRSQIFA